jgi:tape measure domain-containing protein
MKSLGVESRSAQQVSNWLDQIVQQGLKGADKTKQLNAVRDFLADAIVKAAGSNIEARLQPIRGQGQTSATRSMPNLNEMLDRIANLTENPRAAQRMLRMLPERRITTDLIGAANKQAEFKQEGLKFLDLKGKAFDPLLKAIAKDFTEYTKSVGTTNPWIGKTGTVLADFLSKGIMSASARELYARVRDPQQSGQLLLPAAGQTSASRMTRQMFEGLPAIQSPQIGMEQAPLSRAAEYLINKARRALELSIGPASPYAPNPFAGMATTPPRSLFRFGQGPQLPGAPIQAALPPAGTTTNYGGGGFFGYGGVRGTGGGGASGSGGGGGRGGALAFPGGNMGPSSPLPQNYLEIGKVIKGIDPILQRSSVPFSGAIRELGEEFGFAIKQVLLFGTAYKALAFFMDLPAQALRASTALQSFNNQLNAITGGTPQAARSMEFINSTVERFNIPLQSAREGFLRLYASMSPAGMNAGMIENLFVGISQASATLGLSSDQVNRVTYAFSQMASKGKVMSEEVTGQLGDVIPGALSLMADAAGMSMADFKQAMEDGLVSGKAMEQLFTNLPIVLEQRFGKGAAGAAQTLQGQLNNLATSTMRLYEAFEPIVNSIAGVVLPALSAGLADAQSAVAAFGMKIEGINPATNLLSENAQNIYRNLEIVADTASSLVSIVQSLGGVFNALGGILSGTLQLLAIQWENSL